MTRHSKEIVQYSSAVFSLCVGFVLIFIGFFTPPVGEVHSSIIGVFGEIIVFVSAVFGLSLYTKTEIQRQLEELKAK